MPGGADGPARIADDVGDETTAAPGARVVVRPAAEPLVSIVVVTYGTGTLVLDVLAAVVRHTTIAAEVLVVDNVHPERPATRGLLRAETAGVRLLTPSGNLGFGGANDLAVEACAGRLVCLLNPDVVVADGWLEPLVAALDDPVVGIAGPVLLNEDGSIQEAGQVVYADGWTGAIGGPHVMPADESQLFSRDVDYVSAACWLVRRDEHLRRGGFDARYHPAFFEDVDYALRVEAGGQRTRLVVDVPIVHHRGHGGAGLGVDVDPSHDIFMSAWGDRVATHPPAPATDDDARRNRDRLAAAKVAWVDRGASPADRRRALAAAVDHARRRPRERVTFITGSAAGLDVAPARRAGVEVAIGDVDAITGGRRAELTALHEIEPAAPLGRSWVRGRWVVLGALVVALVFAAVLRPSSGDSAVPGSG